MSKAKSLEKKLKDIYEHGSIQKLRMRHGLPKTKLSTEYEQERLAVRLAIILAEYPNQSDFVIVPDTKDIDAMMKAETKIRIRESHGR